MTQTKRRIMPLALTVVLVLGALFMARQLTDDGDPLPSVTSYQCRGKTVEVEFGADLGPRARPVRIRYWVQGGTPRAHDLKVDWWTTVDPALPCPATAHLTVNPADVWGGNTECWISVNGNRLVEMYTRQRRECSVTVKLIAS